MRNSTSFKRLNDRQKTLLFVGNTAWSMYNFRLEVLQFFSRRYNVVVLAPEDAWGKKLLEKGITYVPIIIDNKGTSPLKDLQLLWQLYRLYKKYSPYLVFHYTIKPNIYGSLAAALCRIKSIAVVTGAGSVFFKDTLLTKGIKCMFRFSFRYSKEVWFLNREDQALFISSRLVNPLKSVLLPSEGINTLDFRPPEFHTRETDGRFRFLYLGRILWDKGIGEYVEAAGKIKKNNRDVVFQILGFLDQRNPSAIPPEMVREWREQGIIEYLGTSDDVRETILHSDCIVLPSFYREGVPRSLLEAASLAKPIIASDVVGCRDVVDDPLTGYLCKPRSASDLQEKMERMLHTSQDERIRMGKSGRAKVKSQFAIGIILKQYQKSLANEW